VRCRWSLPSFRDAELFFQRIDKDVEHGACVLIVQTLWTTCDLMCYVQLGNASPQQRLSIMIAFPSCLVFHLDVYVSLMLPLLVVVVIRFSVHHLVQRTYIHTRGYCIHTRALLHEWTLDVLPEPFDGPSSVDIMKCILPWSVSFILYWASRLSVISSGPMSRNRLP
jgi:hypothetical protein